jgi:hypothetical protein
MKDFMADITFSRSLAVHPDLPAKARIQSLIAIPPKQIGGGDTLGEHSLAGLHITEMRLSVYWNLRDYFNQIPTKTKVHELRSFAKAWSHLEPTLRDLFLDASTVQVLDRYQGIDNLKGNIHHPFKYFATSVTEAYGDPEIISATTSHMTDEYTIRRLRDSALSLDDYVSNALFKAMADKYKLPQWNFKWANTCSRFCYNN